MENADWVFCSNQWQECQCNNAVRLRTWFLDIGSIDHESQRGAALASSTMSAGSVWRNNALRWGHDQTWTFIRPQKHEQMFTVK